MSMAAGDRAAVAPISGGAFVAVVGPSGAGKDTLLAVARAHLAGDPSILFVRRVVTRRADASAEDHDSLSEAEFDVAEQEGRFAIAWRAHGLAYGLPAAIDRHVANGGTAVANVSRTALAILRSRYARVVVVNVTAPPEVLAARIAARGREAAGDAASRLSRTASVEADASIDNSGPVAVGAAALAAAILKAAGH
jgi:ribose 1,5-bisphosphokinase